MTSTPIVIVEDRGLLGLAASEHLRLGSAQLASHGMDGAIQLIASGRSLMKWLNQQPAGTVRLLLLDFSVVGGPSTTALSGLRDGSSGRALHSALHPEAVVIGWSAEPQAAEAFRAARADGFISKARPVPEIVTNITTIIEQRQAGQVWTELL